jgi:hypothetical protein
MFRIPCALFIVTALLVSAPAAGSSATAAGSSAIASSFGGQAQKKVVSLGSRGVWTSLVYRREAPIAYVSINLTEGPGFGSLYVPECPSTPSYSVLDLAGMKAVLEEDELLGASLAVALGENRVLTLESRSLAGRELVEFAMEYLKSQ